MSGSFGRGGGAAGCSRGETCYSTAWQPLHSALMWGRPCTIAGSWGKARDTSRDCPSCDKGLEGMWSQVLLCCVPALPGDLGAGTSTCAHLQGQRSPLYFSCPASLSPFPTAITGQGAIAGPSASPDLSLACAFFPRDSTMSCPSHPLSHSLPFTPARPQTCRKAV